MNFTQHDAALASMNTMDLSIDQMIDKIDQALEVVNDITRYGVTLNNYNQLQSIYPELSEPEISLSSHPIRLGAEEIGNEAIAGLSGGAMAALLGALALVLGWVVSKVFGGGGSGSGGGGGLSSKSGATSTLSDSRVPFDAKTIVSLYDGMAQQASSAKDKNNAARKAGTARVAGYMAERCVDGSLTADIKAMRSLVKDIVALSEGEAPDAEITKIIGTMLPNYLNPIVKKLPYLNDKQKQNAEIKSIQSIDSLGQTRKKEKVALTSAFAINYSSLSFKASSDIKISPSQFGATEKAIKDFEKELESMSKKLKGDSSTKKLSPHISAAYQGLGILLVWVRNDLVKRLADTDTALKAYVASIKSACAEVLNITLALSDGDKKKTLDAAGIDEAKVKEVLASLKKGDLSKCDEAVDLAEVLQKNLSLSDEDKRKLSEALVLRDIF